MRLVRIAARPMLASMFAVGGINSLKNPEMLAPTAATVTDRVVPWLQRAAGGRRLPTDAATWVRVNGAVHVAGAAMLASGRLPRLTSVVLAASLVPTTLAGHPYWKEQDPGARAAQRIHFFKNVSMAGGLLMVTLDRKDRRACKANSN